jgi:predicted protein tyrosine phosphatase
MPSIHVCSLARLGATVSASGASHIITLVDRGTAVPRPESVPVDRHLLLNIHDIAEPQEGYTAPGQRHVEDLLAFVDGWDRKRPLVVHCFAGISRSTAGAFISLCHLAPERQEIEIAARIRRASPTAFPNPLLVGHADQLLGRGGRMVRAVAAIGRGRMAHEGVPFSLPIAG